MTKRSIAGRILRSRFVQNYWFFWAALVLRVRRPLIIGVTGSAGKTTTVALITTVLSRAATATTPGSVAGTVLNMNDGFGLPFTIMRYGRWPFGWNKLLSLLLLPFRSQRLALSFNYPKVLVLECGTDKMGDIPRLVKLAPPAIGIVTTIGPAHLDGLKTVQGVVQEKGAMVSAVPATGLVVLGADHDYVADLQARAKGRVVTVSGSGVEMSRNIARVVATHLGVSDETIDAALSAATPVAGRLNRFSLDGLTVIDDSYNANPMSMRLGLDTLHDSASQSRRRVAFLGVMAELGEQSANYHEQIGQYARTKSDFVVGVGELARFYGPDLWFETSTECADHLKDLVRTDDCILVKGSHSADMSVIVKRLKAMASEAPKSSREASSPPP